MKMIREINDVCKEVLTILAYFNEELIEKIPDKVLKKLTELSKDSKVDFYIDSEKNLDYQNISEEGKNLIALLYCNYIANEDEKKQILKSWDENENKYQENLREKYNPNNIFQSKIGKTAENDNKDLYNNAMIVYREESIFNKIKNFIKRHLKR